MELEPMEKEVREVIRALMKEAKECDHQDAALKYSQAALNIANTLRALRE